MYKFDNVLNRKACFKSKFH